MTLPSATQFPAISFKRSVTDKIYKDHSELLWDIVAIMKTELTRLSIEGVKYIQIDAPRYSYFMDPKWREWIRTEMNIAPDALLDESIRADNTCFAAALASLSRYTSAAEIIAAIGMPKAAMTPSPKNFSPLWLSIVSCWNMTTIVPAPLSRCAWSRARKPSSSA